MQPESISDSLPTNPWKLTAPDSYILLHGPDAGGGEPLRFGLLELIARRLLAIYEVEERSFFGPRRTSVLVDGVETDEPLERPLEAVRSIFQRLQPYTYTDGTVGVPVAEFAQAAQQLYHPPSRFAAEEVLPGLIRRGLYAREAHKGLWIFPATRLVLTPAGRAARAELADIMALGEREIPGWAERDRNSGLAYLAMAGAAALLLPQLYPEFREIGSGSEVASLFFDSDLGAIASLDAAFEESGGDFESPDDAGDGDGGDGD